MTILPCMICGAPAHAYRTLEVDVLTSRGTLHKGETVRLCGTCVSAHGFMLGGEYGYRKYGDDYTFPDGRCKVDG